MMWYPDTTFDLCSLYFSVPPYGLSVGRARTGSMDGNDRPHEMYPIQADRLSDLYH